jgi:hypothetical protein
MVSQVHGPIVHTILAFLVQELVVTWLFPIWARGFAYTKIDLSRFAPLH